MNDRRASGDEDVGVEREPSQYRLALLIVLGYAFLGLVLAVFAAELAFLGWGLWSRRPIIGLVAVLGGLPLLRITWAAIRSLFFRAELPHGITVTRADAPTLYALVDDVRRAIRAPAVHCIVVTGLFNASAMTCSGRLGFGRRRALLIGLPALATLSPPELRAVIAHELAHFSRWHGHFTAWVYRTRVSWFRLAGALGKRRATPAYVSWLVHWYLPRLDACSARVSRQHEFEADACAARAAGSRVTADALIAFDAGAAYVDECYWPGVVDSVRHEGEPPHPYVTLVQQRAARISGTRGAAMLEQLLADTTTAGDSHPCLRDRLERLGEGVRVPPPLDPTATPAYDDELHGLAERLDEEWRAKNAEEWRKHHAELRQKQNRATSDVAAAG